MISFCKCIQLIYPMFFKCFNNANDMLPLQNIIISDIISWDTIPCELLILIFENLDFESLTTCFYVNEKWRNLAKYVAHHKNKFKSMFEANAVNRLWDYNLKSNNLSWDSIYLNMLQWHYVDQSVITFCNKYTIQNIKKVNIYKDNIIVVNCSNVKYYSVKNFELRRNINVTCIDFTENNSLIVKITHNWDIYKNLHLYGKLKPDDFNMSTDNEQFLDGVQYYKIIDNNVYVMNNRNILTLFVYADDDWHSIFLGKYYGGMDTLCSFSAFNDDSFLLLKWGPIMFTNKDLKNLIKVFDIEVPETKEAWSIYTKIFHRFGFVFGLGADKEFKFKRYVASGHAVYIFECPNLSCATEHGDVLFLGYNDGKVEVYIPRAAEEENVFKRRLDFSKYYENKADAIIVSIEAFEDEGFHHLFVSTHTDVFHIEISDPSGDSYMWKEIPELVNVGPDRMVPFTIDASI